MDTGIGISKENLNRLFTPFFTTKAKGKGVGLGLSVVHGIIGKHKGKIEVESEPDVGTTFSIYLEVMNEEKGSSSHC
jgi:signal transduction histidine kinase